MHVASYTEHYGMTYRKPTFVISCGDRIRTSLEGGKLRVYSPVLQTQAVLVNSFEYNFKKNVGKLSCTQNQIMKSKGRKVKCLCWRKAL